MRKKWIGIAALAVVLVVPIAIALVRPKESRSVEIQKVEQRELKPAILASGALVYKEQVQLTPEVIGKVSEILIKEGDLVKSGQIVLRLNPESFRAEVAQQEAVRRQALISIERARLNVANQEREHARFVKLVADKMIEASKVDQTKHQLEVSKVELRSTEEALRNTEAQLTLAFERLAKTEIRSPLSGKVTALSIKVGETAVVSSTNIAGSSLMTIANTESIAAEINVDEADIAQIATGQTTSIFASAFPDQPLRASVESVSLAPKQGGQGRMYVVKTKLHDTANLALRTGMSCRAEIYTGKLEKSLAVPVQAVLQETEDKKNKNPARYVFLSVAGKAERRTVEVGIADDNHIEIRTGLQEDDLVVSGPERELKQLRAGDRLKALEKKDMKK